MIRFKRYTDFTVLVLILTLLISSCKEFLDPRQDVEITEDQLYDDWYEYRSVAMGMYGIQKELTEQLFVLGELRGDLVNITKNADADLVEIYNFNPSRENKYASPLSFFKLISVCNNLIKILQEKHPEVVDPASPVNNYDRLYGEALCMRAWTYFNGVRIYRKVPFIHESLTTIEEIEAYINSSETYVDSVHIVFDTDGYHNDTLYNKPIELEKKFFDQDLVIDFFTNELENKVKAVGVNHHMNNNDLTWEVTIWNTHAMNALLGIMYLTEGDLVKAASYFEDIVYLSSDNSRYQIDGSFSNTSWQYIFNNVDIREHIYSIWYNKNYFQQNDLQIMCDARSPNKYMLKPSKIAVLNWENIWDDFVISAPNGNPGGAETVVQGTPGDFFRGYGVSYNYSRDGIALEEDVIREMLYLRSQEDIRSANTLVANTDTVIWKYSIGKSTFDHDANFIVYRAAGIHLWLAEVYTYWAFLQNNIVREFTINAVNIVNNGTNYSTSPYRSQMGVRGRVGFGDRDDGIKVGNIAFERDPYTNEIVGYKDFSEDFTLFQQHLEELILDERARELSFEGERFYDLMRVAQRRNDPSFLAEKVSKKYPSGKREEIYNLLLDENNWYINYFDD